MILRRALLPALAAILLFPLVVHLRAPAPARSESHDAPPLAARHVQADPYGGALLAGYSRYRDALLAGDFEVLAELSAGTDYLAYRAALALARHPDVPLERRLGAYRRVLELRIDDPLARRERQELWLEYARTAEITGEGAAALDAYREALPHEDAVRGLERLVSDPYRRSNEFLKARLYRRALEALDGRAAPSIEAPALRRLGEHERALDAYRRWLAEVPDSLEARAGIAWELFYLGRNAEAEAAFRRLEDGPEGSSALYGRALLANRAGDVSEAVALLERSGEPSHLWLATSLLEGEGRMAEAVRVYLALARMGGVYADDAAYRARVLAERQGNGEAAALARALVPPGSFFDLKLGGLPPMPEGSLLPPASPPVLALAQALWNAGDREAAIGELQFALRSAPDEPSVVAIAERLQAYGEYRQSQRAATLLVAAGSRDERTWRLAYPRAYPEAVLEHVRAHDVEPALLWAIMRQESAFYPQAVSVANARGLMQVIPSTWDWLAELQNERPGDPFDPDANIRYGAFYLDWLWNYLGGDAELVVSSYNRGQGYIKRLFEGEGVAGDKDELYRDIDALETREYLQRVMVNYAVYRELYGEDGGGERVPARGGD